MNMEEKENNSKKKMEKESILDSSLLMYQPARTQGKAPSDVSDFAIRDWTV